MQLAGNYDIICRPLILLQHLFAKLFFRLHILQTVSGKKGKSCIYVNFHFTSPGFLAIDVFPVQLEDWNITYIFKTREHERPQPTQQLDWCVTVWAQSKEYYYTATKAWHDTWNSRNWIDLVFQFSKCFHGCLSPLLSNCCPFPGGRSCAQLYFI